MPRPGGWTAARGNVPDRLPAGNGDRHRMSAHVDVLVVGAGPGGLVAAATAAEAGTRVALVDDNSSPGGQIWRSGIDKQNQQAAQLLRRLQSAPVETRFGWRAVAAPAPNVLRIEQAG